MHSYINYTKLHIWPFQQSKMSVGLHFCDSPIITVSLPNNCFLVNLFNSAVSFLSTCSLGKLAETPITPVFLFVGESGLKSLMFNVTTILSCSAANLCTCLSDRLTCLKS